MESREERYYTPEEYLALEDASPAKHEYYDGRIYAMTGSTLSHAQITMNVQFQLVLQLRGRPCRSFNTDVKVLVSASGLYTYPDASALCGESRFQETNSAVLLNPSVIVEVLSPSTEGYDRGEKYTHYKRLPSLREYVLISQDRPRVERFARGGNPDDGWDMTMAEGLDATIELPSIGCTLALRDVYEHVDLSPRPPLRAVYEQQPQYAANF